MRLAPQLQDIASNNWWGPKNDGNDDDAWEAASKELRALLAVARAVQRQANVGNNWPKVLRALERLRRLSVETP